MPSKILSFLCHVPSVLAGSYPVSPMLAAPKRAVERKLTEAKAAGGHFTAIYENERFIRFKYINHTGN